MSKTAVIDIETGEVLQEIHEGDSFRITRKESKEAKGNVDKTQEWAIGHFYKGNIKENRQQLKNLNVYEKAFIYSIVTYIGYEDCCIKYDNGNPLDFDNLVEISGMSRGKCSATINSLIKKDIVYKGKNSKGFEYFVNPWMFSKGNKIQKVLKAMFRNYRIKIRDNQKWSDIPD